MQYRFDEFELDVSRRTLRRAGRPVSLQPKILDLLIFLVRHGQRVASRQELLQAIWPDLSVGDAALRRLLKEARHVLGDDGVQQRLIVTARGYGYRLAAPIEIVGLGGGDDNAYIGRESELACFESRLESSVAGKGAILLVAGEPGIGKTRLATEAAEMGRLVGARVLAAWGAQQEGTPAYWPWLQVLRELSDGSESNELRSILGGVGPELAELAPWLRDRHPDLVRVISLEPESARFRLFDAFRLVLERSAARRPLLVILEDIHWADAQSVQLLEFLAHSIAGQRLLIIATYRQEEMRREPTRAESFVRIASNPAITTLTLAGFSRDEVSRFIKARTGLDPPNPVVEALHVKTEGNPLLLGEILRSAPGERLAELVDPHACPESAPLRVEQVMARRLQMLPDQTRRLLQTASAIGREFDAVLLQSVVPEDAAGLANILDDAVRHRIVSETPTGAYRFSHMLIRDALYAELQDSQRAALHRSIGTSLEAGGGETAVHVHALAQQFFAAFSSGDADKAIEYTERAGDLSAAVYASEQAARHYGHAVDVFQLQRNAEPHHLCSLLLKLGDAQRWNGDHAGSVQSCRCAAEIARAAGWAPELARAALIMGGWPLLMRPRDIELSHLLEEAITALGDDHLALRAELLARLAAEYCIDPDVGTCLSLRRRALDAALASGSGIAVGRVLGQPYSGIWETTVPKASRLSIAMEAAQRCHEAGKIEDALHLEELATEEYLARGQLDLFDAEIERLMESANRLGNPGLIVKLLYRQSARSLFVGRFEESEALSQQAFELAQRRVDVAGARQLWVVKLIILRAEQGRLAELLPALEGMDHVGDQSLTFECFRAWIYADVGHARAREVLDGIMADGLPALAEYHSGGAQCAVLAHVCARLGAVQYAPRLYDFLEPLRGELIVRGRLACHGPASYFLGLLAGLCGRTMEARELFAEALALCERIGAKTGIARTSQALARLLAAGGEAAERQRALELVRRSVEIAEQLGMQGLVVSGRAFEQEMLVGVPHHGGDPPS